MLYLESPFHNGASLDGLLGEIRPMRGLVIYVVSVSAAWGEDTQFTFTQATHGDS
jgi:hypothetical protein